MDPTTTTRPTTTTTTTTTTTPPNTTSADPPTTVPEPAATMEAITTKAITPGSETTIPTFPPETDASKPDDDEMSTTYLVIAITLSIAACIIAILVVCFITYRRGLKKKQAQAELEMGLDPRVRAQRQRVSEQKDSEGQKLSTIDEKNQSANGISDSNQSPPKNQISADVTMENPGIRSSGAFNQSNGGVQNGGAHAEPQYVNLATTRVVSSHEDLTNSGEYLDLNNTPPNSDLQTNQSDESRNRFSSMNSQLDAPDDQQRDSVYENVQGAQSEASPMHPEAIYQNTMQNNEEENLYEQAIKPSDQIYVDMK